MKTMRKISPYLLILILLCYTGITFATQRISVVSGNWEATSTWSGSAVPANGDTIYIMAGHTVTVNTANSTLQTGAPVYLEIFGTLAFGNGKKLNLPCNSGVSLKPGGQIVGAGGGGASNQLTICGNTVWQSSDGNATGPLSYGSPLPVKLLSFNALFSDGKVDLTWVTASEVNNDFFTIEKSRDGKSFEDVAIVKGSGTTNTLMEYFETDYQPLTGISYYRLKQTDFDGSFSYSPLVPVNYKVNGTSEGLKIYPNPIASTQKIFVEVPASAMETLVVLRDMAGAEYYSKVILTAQGNELVGIDVERKLAPGTYLVVASSDNKIFSEKLIVR